MQFKIQKLVFYLQVSLKKKKEKEKKKEKKKREEGERQRITIGKTNISNDRVTSHYK